MKFSIRDLFLVTVIVAVGWWVDRSRLSQVIESQKADRALAEERARIDAALNAVLTSSPPVPNPTKP